MIDFITEKQIIYEYYTKKYVSLHIYEIGDLDDFFFPRTKWIGSRIDEKLNFLALFYDAPGLTVLLALGGDQKEVQNGISMFQEYMSQLPNEFYAHLSPGLSIVFDQYYHFEPHGLYSKMVIEDHTFANKLAKDCLLTFSKHSPIQLNESHLNEVVQFYSEAYPGNWFDPKMLETKQFFGLYIDVEADKDHNKEKSVERRIVAIAGIHVYSPQYRVCSLGNIATLPQYRGKGFGKLVTAALVQSLLQSGSIDVIGLNVLANNHIAIRCYESLGFRFVDHYEEIMMRKK